MINETVIFKYGKGITQEVTYLGPVLTDGILKHKIRTWNDTDFLVNRNLLSSLDLSDIATIPVTKEQYAVEFPKLMHPQLEQISNPQTLDDDQHKLMNLHYKMNHLSLPAMITLAEKGKSIRDLQNSKIGFPYVCLASLARLIAVHGNIKDVVEQFEKRPMMLPENVLVLINWYLLNRV
jgi:hypothetical protein